MAAEAICDGCGKKDPMLVDYNCPGSWLAPKGWWLQQKGNDVYITCSAECAVQVEKEAAIGKKEVADTKAAPASGNPCA